MIDPLVKGIPLSLLFLYFVTYSFVGWTMETTYCSTLQKRFVPRGFLYGPLCPIYGVGALLMILFFEPLAGNLFLFYVVSTVVMSAWEYLVGWFLETTTHMKYWDYSNQPFNLHGRICLFVSLWWGVLSYIAISYIHPAVADLFAYVPNTTRYVIAYLLLSGIIVDAVFTIRSLALVTKMLKKLEQTGSELAVQLELGKLELTERLDEAREKYDARLSELMSQHPETSGMLKERYLELRERYSDLQERAERASRRFRKKYSHLSSPRYGMSLADIRKHAGELRARVTARKNEPKE